MTPRKLPENALPVGGHWEWKEFGLNVHGWADENGLLHREGALAWIVYRQDGTIGWELWYLHGKLHREGAPAWIEYWPDGTIRSEWWYLHGEGIEREYPMGCYQDVQAQIGHAAMWTLPGNLIPVLSGFLQ